jgi:hypothetical protein
MLSANTRRVVARSPLFAACRPLEGPLFAARPVGALSARRSDDNRTTQQPLAALAALAALAFTDTVAFTDTGGGRLYRRGGPL